MKMNHEFKSCMKNEEENMSVKINWTKMIGKKVLYGELEVRLVGYLPDVSDGPMWIFDNGRSSFMLGREPALIPEEPEWTPWEGDWVTENIKYGVFRWDPEDGISENEVRPLTDDEKVDICGGPKSVQKLYRYTLRRTHEKDD